MKLETINYLKELVRKDMGNMIDHFCCAMHHTNGIKEIRTDCNKTINQLENLNRTHKEYLVQLQFFETQMQESTIPRWMKARINVLVKQYKDFHLGDN